MNKQEKVIYDHARYLRRRDDPSRLESAKRAGKVYRERHRETINAKRRKRYAHDPGRDYQAHRKWVAANTDSRAEKMRAWRERNREIRRLYDAAYRESHREERAETQNARRARQIANGGSHTRAEWIALKYAFENRCAYCAATGRLTKDHATPLARGGSDYIENIVPACLPCNQRKHAKTASEFMALLVSAA